VALVALLEERQCLPENSRPRIAEGFRCACDAGALDAVQCLLQLQGRDAVPIVEWNEHAMRNAAALDAVPLLQVLLQHRACSPAIPQDWEEELCIAVGTDSAGAAACLLPLQAALHNGEGGCLHSVFLLACSVSADMAQRVLHAAVDGGAHVQEWGDAALLTASSAGVLPVMRLALEANSSFPAAASSGYMDALTAACLQGGHAAVLLLLQARGRYRQHYSAAAWSEGMRVAFHAACQSGDGLAVLHLLLLEEPDAVPHAAQRVERLTCVRLLLSWLEDATAWRVCGMRRRMKDLHWLLRAALRKPLLTAQWRRKEAILLLRYCAAPQ